MADKDKKPKEKLVTLFCDNCGETRIHPESVAEHKIGKHCTECLNGTMTLAFTLTEPGSTV